MVRRFTFPLGRSPAVVGGEATSGLTISYWRTSDKHRLLVKIAEKPEVQVGPLVSLNNVLSYEWMGRWFVGQALTEDLPLVFELLPSMETVVELKEPSEGKPN